jgi:hypothetical protein
VAKLDLIGINELVNEASPERMANNPRYLDRLAIEKITNIFLDMTLWVRGVKANKVETKELCIDDICVTKTQLQQMIQNSQSNGGGNTGENILPSVPTTTSGIENTWVVPGDTSSSTEQSLNDSVLNPSENSSTQTETGTTNANSETGSGGSTSQSTENTSAQTGGDTNQTTTGQ